MSIKENLLMANESATVPHENKAETVHESVTENVTDSVTYNHQTY